MTIYLAGAENKKHYGILVSSGAKNVLFSYYYLSTHILDARRIIEEGMNVFMDSGGYSARVRGVQIDITKYGSFLVNNKQYIRVAANLDTSSWDESQRNFDYLYSLGVKVLPVFHYSDYKDGKLDIFSDWCDRYGYIALGGMAGVVANVNSLSNFMNACFKIAIPKKTKLHGFGMTSIPMLFKYPFYSVDSTSWMASARYGIVNRWEGMGLKGYQFRDRKIVMSKGLLPEKYVMTDRLKDNIREFRRMESDVTKLWQSRGMEYWN